MVNPDWKNKETRIAIANSETGQWEFYTFDTWELARESVNAAREQGKTAVFYDGATFLLPPELERPQDID